MMKQMSKKMTREEVAEELAEMIPAFAAKMAPVFALLDHRWHGKGCTFGIFDSGKAPTERDIESMLRQLLKASMEDGGAVTTMGGLSVGVVAEVPGSLTGILDYTTGFRVFAGATR